MKEFIGLICLTYLFVDSSIMQKIKHLFGISNLDSPTRKIQIFFQELLNCCMCSGFWIFLLCYQDLYLAAIGSILTETLKRIIDKI